MELCSLQLFYLITFYYFKKGVVDFAKAQC
jgi:hypothetical protein